MKRNKFCSTDDNFDIFSENLQNLNTNYFLPEEAALCLENYTSDNFSILNLNIRSLNKNFESLKSLLSSLNFCFKIISLTETWTKESDISQNSLLNLPNYTIIQQNRESNKKGGGVCVYIHNSLTYKVRYYDVPSRTKILVRCVYQISVVCMSSMCGVYVKYVWCVYKNFGFVCTSNMRVVCTSELSRVHVRI